MSEQPLPRHVAVIMDGNGRWAKARGMLRFHGHQRGAEALRRVTRHAARAGIQELTFFALSTENFRRRPRGEIDFLMKLLRQYLVEERKELAENNIRLKTIGRVEELPEEVRRELETTLTGSANHTGMVLRLALNYGARQEIVDGARRILELARSGHLDLASLDEDGFRRFLYEPQMPDPDLLIRTAGELRLSNFFLWQASYSELWVTEVLWPEFEPSHFEEALRAYRARLRKFGGVEELPPALGADLARSRSLEAPSAAPPAV
jgi:undecaprenyl diphosphate synthase